MNKNLGRGCALLLFGLLAAGATAIASAATSSATVTVDTGKLQGDVDGNVGSFKGIPFALPPVGELRWRPPQAAAKWQGVRKATTYGADCMQIPFPSDAAPLGVKPAEDCLYLNVWRPAHAAGKKLPVLVWIYGGGFVNGGSSPAVYDGGPFARDGVIFVSFNYRLGRFGFFAHPALSAEQPGGPLANYAIMDQIAALKWVRRNIAAFGGDPNNVTICGESAGGMSVHVLMTSPLAAGLFQKAIVQSGGGRTNLMRGRPLVGGPDSAEALGVAFAKGAGIEATGAQALKMLRALPAEALLNNLNLATMSTAAATYVGGPVLDGKVMPAEPAKVYADGKAARVPLMVGANSLDIGFMKGDTIDELLAQFGANADKARNVYEVKSGDDVKKVAFRMGGDQMMGEPARYVARALAAHGQPVYEYRFSYVAESMRQQWPGAMHASDIPYAFDTVAARYGNSLTAQDAAAAHTMHAYWVAFAASGKPELPGKPAWPAYDAKSDTLMDFTNSGPVVGSDPWRARFDLAEGVNVAHEAAPPQAR
ncbi:MAG: pnbA1 [Gammaproteobacteria bacterium]|nr:pnbA1 [Gammaproteobacteria bacterium]